MPTKIATKRASYQIAEFKAVAGGSPGEFTALVSVFGNVDQVGDRVMAGAFTKSLSRWKTSGDPIPVIWSHDWQNPYAHIGVVTDAVQTPAGLQIVGKNDLDKPFAAQVHDLLITRRVKEFSFAYDILDESRAQDGANELNELDLIEVGPTLKGCNPETELIAAKALRAAEREKGVPMPLASLSGRKIWVDEGIDGTYEDTQEDIFEAATLLFNPSGADGIWVSVQGTFPDHVIIEVCTRGGGDDEYYDVPWSYAADGETVTLGTPAPVDVSVTVSPAAEGDKSLKLGRRLSNDTMTKMQQIHDGMGSLQDDMKALMGMAEEEPKGRKSAIAVHHTGTDKGSWDGPANEKRVTSPNDAGVGYFGKIFAWRDSADGADPDVKASYKFIHHDVAEDGTAGKANLTACSAGIGVLNGGMAGTTIPDADREGVYAHLAAHLRDAEMEPPPLKKIEANVKGTDREPQATSDPATLMLRTRIAEMRAT